MPKNKPRGEAGALWQREWRKAKPAKRMLYSARRRALVKGIPCTITEQDIQEIIPTVCPYLGIPLVSQITRGNPRMNTLSLDRIIPELGYIKSNIQVISHLANSMKSNATKEQLLIFARKILDDESSNSRRWVHHKTEGSSLP